MTISKVKTSNYEEWRPVDGFEGQYEVSNTGEVKSLNFHRSGREKILKQYVDRYGYLKVVLYKNGKPHYFTVHRLVAAAFLEKPHEKGTVDHIDCNTKNNHVSNLRWVTSNENLFYSHKLGHQHINAVPIIASSPDRNTYRFRSQKEAARITGVGQWAISRALQGKSPDLKGWSFSYDSESIDKK